MNKWINEQKNELMKQAPTQWHNLFITEFLDQLKKYFDFSKIYLFQKLKEANESDFTL